MATLCMGDTSIDYSIVSGAVHEFSLDGRQLYCERSGVSSPGWKDALVSLVMDMGWNCDKDGHGLREFVIKLIADGDMQEEPCH